MRKFMLHASLALCACGPAVAVDDGPDSGADEGTDSSATQDGSTSSTTTAEDASTGSAADESSSGEATPEPHVRLPAMNVDPDVNEAAVRAAVFDNEDAIKACYTASLGEGPIDGRLTLVLEIDATSVPTGVSVHTSEFPQTLRSCLIAEAATWVFELSSAEFTTATVPLSLTAG